MSTKAELIAICLDRGLVKNVTQARSMKVDELRALIIDDDAATPPVAKVEDTSSGHALDCACASCEENDERAERRSNPPEPLPALVGGEYKRISVDEAKKAIEAIDAYAGADIECANQIVWGGKSKPRLEVQRRRREERLAERIDQIRALPERNRAEKRRKAALLKIASRAA
jgi:hypothetical protein